MRRASAGAAAALLLAGAAIAQDAPRPPEAAASQTQIPTLDEVRALQPDEEEVDLYRFRNPVELEANRFDRAWRPPPSPEQVSMQGGYVIMGINYLLGKGLQGLGRITGGPGPIQAAVARPLPLDDAQLLRAAAFCDADAMPCDRAPPPATGDAGPR